MKIIVRTAGGLANRMFHYALYKNFLHKGFEAYIDDNYKADKWDFENVVLEDVFPNVRYNTLSKWQIFKLGGGYDIFSKIYRRLPFKKAHFYYSASEFGYNQSVFDFKKNMYITGVFQSEKYFENIFEDIRNSFVFKPFINPLNIEIKQKMEQEESVAIHIRKGLDYDRENMHGTCTADYYYSAIGYIQNHIKNPKFYLFTDNKKWVEDNIKNIKYQLIDWNPVCGSDNYLDMQLMSCAKHNIIANSTYSWWSAWLNNNPDKIVIGPKYWYNPNMKQYYAKDLNIIPKLWQSL